MGIWTVILIIAVIAAIILGVLYFVGRKMQAKQEDLLHTLAKRLEVCSSSEK